MAEEAVALVRPVIDRVAAQHLAVVGGRQEAGNHESRDVVVGRFLESLGDVEKADDLDPAPEVLHGGDEVAEVAVPAQQDDAVQVLALKKRVDAEIHVHVGLDGHLALRVGVSLYGLFDELESVAAQDVVIPVELAPVLVVLFDEIEIFHHVGVGPQDDRVFQRGVLLQNVVAHSITPAEADVLPVNVDTCLDHVIPSKIHL